MLWQCFSKPLLDDQGKKNINKVKASITQPWRLTPQQLQVIRRGGECIPCPAGEVKSCTVASRLPMSAVVCMTRINLQGFATACRVVQWCKQPSWRLVCKATMVTKAMCQQPKQPQGGFWCRKVNHFASNFTPKTAAISHNQSDCDTPPPCPQ